MSWDPQEPHQMVRLIDKPGKTGITTGNTKHIGTKLMVQVRFGPKDKVFKSYDLLEPVVENEDISDILASERFGDVSDLRRILIFEKVKGELTNIFYSMGVSNTQFYPHQFKAVLRFIESPVGRLLIADEVGLGKTIESIYVWKELQARENVQRLLIVCPAMLREKWKRDLHEHFNISADIVKAKDLLYQLKKSKSTAFVSFHYIVSFESIRPSSRYESESLSDAKSEIARLLDSNKAIDQQAAFDLTIIDEAHYMRNLGTANNRLGRLLREASHHLLLLTATPVQTSNDNLYNILRLIDPDVFHDHRLFEERLDANKPIIAASKYLRSLPPETNEAAKSIGEALKKPYFKNDEVLTRIQKELEKSMPTDERRLELSMLLENRSLLSQYMVRTRKREVLEKRAKRASQVLRVNFSDIEREIYKQVTRYLWRDMQAIPKASPFVIIMRQRQMASSLVAALRSWQANDAFGEFFWEDLGIEVELDEFALDDQSLSGHSVGNNDLQAIERQDSKYQKLYEFIREALNKKSSEKIVVFAFFRATLNYLRSRLENDGIRTALVLGGMGDDGLAHIEDFKSSEGPSVLLSSEVGSEGIDLQFCRILVNYDLPWNPMRVEQRIGRLDRLGQQAEQISIVNFVVEDTIEDRILMRLYDRINIFEESIGDLEAILGAETYNLIESLLDPSLDDDERAKREKEAFDAIVTQRKNQELLEDESSNLIGLWEFVHEQISSSCKLGRWLSSNELLSLVDDFFKKNYLGSKIALEKNSGAVADIELSSDARTDLNLFVQRHKSATHTRLHLSHKPIRCFFDPIQARKFGLGAELIDATHPLVQWIKQQYIDEDSASHPVSAICVDAKYLDGQVEPGDYAYAIQKWTFDGLRKESVLSFAAIKVESGEKNLLLSDSCSEQLVTLASRQGKTLQNAASLMRSMSKLEDLIRKVEVCNEKLNSSFRTKEDEVKAQNALRCNQQEVSAKIFMNRRVNELRERIHRYRLEGKNNVIPATEGLIKKEEDQFSLKMKRISAKRNVDPSLEPLAGGLIRVL